MPICTHLHSIVQADDVEALHYTKFDANNVEPHLHTDYDSNNVNAHLQTNADANDVDSYLYSIISTLTVFTAYNKRWPFVI